MKYRSLHGPVLRSGVAVVPALALPACVFAATVANPLCLDNTALFSPDEGKDITVPTGTSTIEAISL